MDNVIVYLQITCPTLGIYLGGVMTYEGGHVLCPIELRADLLVTFVSPANPNYTLVTSTLE